MALEQGDRLVVVPTRDDKFKTRISAGAFRNIHDQVTGFDGVAKVSHEGGGAEGADDHAARLIVI